MFSYLNRNFLADELTVNKLRLSNKDYLSPYLSIPINRRPEVNITQKFWLKMAKKPYANILFCVKLSKCLRYKPRIVSSYNKLAITAFSYFTPCVNVTL